MKLKLVIAAVVLSLICGCGCCGPDEDENLGPSTDLQQVVDRGSFAWTSARMWEDAWVVFHSPAAEWRCATSIEDLVQYFVDLGVEVGDEAALWDYQVLVSDIQSDSIYLAKDPPLDVFVAQLVGGLKHAETQLTSDFGE